MLSERLKNEWDIAEHVHGNIKHIHAWSQVNHAHILRAVCMREECKDSPTHNIHRMKYND